ncbi:MAG: DUF3179 domain-containing protein [Rhodothermales bacterium]|nr:DUF3179 domain-containing protein [Rhodothermales bacterium]
MRFLSLVVAITFVPILVSAQPVQGWKTDWNNRSIDLSEIISGGVPKDGIPPVDSPEYVPVEDARNWIDDREPVVLVTVGGESRAYPLQILTFHEIVNTEVGGKPVAVTFCPLCYSTLVFDRELEGVIYDFGVSGMLRFSDLLMYDRQTESLWQQILGTAVVGELNGKQLHTFPSQIISFKQFYERHPDALVLSRNTGHTRDYGTNPYPGYDDIDDRPFLFRGEIDDRLPPMERVVTVSIADAAKAYPYRVTRKRNVINDEVGTIKLVVFHTKGATSALDKSNIKKSEEIGSTGVFERMLDGQLLTFSYQKKRIVDTETNSVWDITGRSVEGPLAGRQLTPVTHGNYFSFAWFAFKPGTGVYRE